MALFEKVDVSEFAFHDLVHGDQDLRWCFKYVHDVLDGTIQAGKWIKLACKRFIRMCEDDRYYFDFDAAKDVIDFFKFVPITDGVDRGKPTSLYPWQIFLVCNIVAWKWVGGDAPNTRVFNQAYVQVGRKAGKSTLAGGLTLYFMLKSGVHRPRAYSVATKRDQAKELWKAAASMIKNGHRLNQVFEARANDILLPHLEGEFYPLASESNSLDGKNPLVVNLDECHAIKDRNLYGVMVSAFGAQASGYLLLVITTAGFILDGLCTDLNKNGKMVLEQKITQDNYLYMIYEIDEKDEWNDTSVRVKANPGYPHQPSKKYMDDRTVEAEMSATERQNFKTKHCNLFISGADKWLDSEELSRCRDTGLKLSNLTEELCYAGVDRARVHDLTSIALTFPTDDGGCNTITRSILPEETFKTVTDYMKEVYLKAIEEGSLKLIPGAMIRDEDVKDFIREINNGFNVEMWGYDPWKMTEICLDLDDEGLPMVAVSQGTGNMSEPAKKLEGLIKDQTFHYNDNMIEFAATNAVCKTTDADNVKITRERPDTDKIDPIIATIISLSCATLQKVEKDPYEERGILFL